ncbi:prolyl 4-hydroxylase subunit alpha-3 [Aplysia californica]|uniref:Prolyl 4-hydroxylase subunit alpha-3 n=1 Tax=Aplysia californica TaxID=6500 RepID=A0ABM1ABC7_APLCA|nr:prolyl 4-hydroxylase subunit alpha-3 [Aplysia californica]
MGRVSLFGGDVARAEQMYHESRDLDPRAGDVLQLKKELSTKPRVDAGRPADYFHNFSRLCSLENKHHSPVFNHPRIVCRYRPGLLPYYRVKEEILSESPFASVVYDVITDEENYFLRTHVKNKLIRGRVGGADAWVSEVRTSDIAWIWDSDSPIAQSLSLRVQAITGLDVKQRVPGGPSSSEAFQVVNYGLGGHYEVHMDPFDKPSDRPELQGSGERIATFLIYLSDVQRGGSTVFTRAGVSVAPVKNMALLWYNFTPALKRDDLTEHAGCPVLIGQKWIANKWIWTYGNTFRRRCGLTPDATHLDIEPDMYRRYGVN